MTERSRATVVNAVGIALALMLASGMNPASATAQELEPGAYWPLPMGLNIVTAVNSVNFGDVAFEPSAPIDEASATINTLAFSYTQAIGTGRTIGEPRPRLPRGRRPRGRPLFGRTS